jgi:YfiH family protein
LLPFTHHFFTTASLRLRHDDTDWKKVAQFAGVSHDRLRMLRQVHGRTVAVAEKGACPQIENTLGTGPVGPEADAIVSDDPSVALVVRVADCAPILVVDTHTGAVGAIHAGWRSTMQGIVDAALTKMRERFDTRPADVIAAIGPSLGACCGEMGEEVVEAFRDAGHGSVALERWFIRETRQRPHFDLWRANRDQLEAGGVPSTAIHISGLCTSTYPDVFHSFRAAGSAAGRMAAVIRASANR